MRRGERDKEKGRRREGGGEREGERMERERSGVVGRGPDAVPTRYFI